jgi:hypothetical protein
MAWTYAITGTERSGDQTRILIDYDDGNGIIVHDSATVSSSAHDLNWLKAHIAWKLSELAAISEFSDTIVPGTLSDLNPATPPTPPAPLAPVIQTTPFSKNSALFDGDAASATCTKGQATNIDYIISAQDHPAGEEITGGMLIAQNNVAGDWIEAQVVYGGNVVYQWIKKWYVPLSGFVEVQTPYAGTLPPNATLRIIYHSTGATDVWAASNYFLHAPL